MNARIINLRTRRKQKARDAAKKTADANAVKFGQPKAVRDLDRARNAQESKKLDGHKLDDTDDS